MPYNYGSSGMTGAPNWSSPVSFGGGVQQQQPAGALGAAMAPPQMNSGGGNNPILSALNPDIMKQLLAQKLKQQQALQLPNPQIPANMPNPMADAPNV